MLRWPLYTRTSRPMTPKGTWTSKKAIKASSTRIWILLKTYIFFSILAFRPLLIKGVFRTPSSPPPPPPEKNRAFRKWSPEWVFLKTPAVSFSCKRAKTEVFECDDVIHHTAYALWGILSNFHLFSVLVWTGESDSGLTSYVWTRILLKTRGKNFLCWKIWGYVCTRSLPRRVRHAFLHHAWRTPKNVYVGG